MNTPAMNILMADQSNSTKVVAGFSLTKDEADALKSVVEYGIVAIRAEIASYPDGFGKLAAEADIRRVQRLIARIT